MTAAQPVARRHHTVPKFYLREFADRDQVTTIQLPGERRFTQSIDDATVNRNFYLVEDHEDGPDVLERAFSALEGSAAAVIGDLKAGLWPLSREARDGLAHFISFQVARVPQARTMIDHLEGDLQRRVAKWGGREALASLLTLDDAEVSADDLDVAWATATAEGGAALTRSQQEYIGSIFNIHNAVVEHMADRPWTLVRFDRRSLFTSDAPVGLIPDPAAPAWMGVGYSNAFAITFPLTRKLALLMGPKTAAVGAGLSAEQVRDGVADLLDPRGSTMTEKMINGATVAAAGEWLYHHPDDSRFVPEQLPPPWIARQVAR